MIPQKKVVMKRQVKVINMYVNVESSPGVLILLTITM